MSILRSRKGTAQGYALGFMILAFVLIGGFMYWLKVASESAEVEVVDPGAETGEEGAGGPAGVTGEEFGAAPSTYFGRRIVLNGVRHSGSLGDHVFWGSIGETRFLVRFDPLTLASGTELTGGDQLQLSGTAHAMGDSVASAWIAEGIVSSADRIELDIAEIYFEASEVRKPGEAGEGASDPESAGSDQG